MSLRNYVSIVFSPQLAAQTVERKKDAIIRLKHYLEDNRDIWTDQPVAKAVAPLLSGRVDLSGRFQTEVTAGELDQKQTQHVQRLGFITSKLHRG